MINVRTLLFGILFGMIDVFSLTTVKKVFLGWNPIYMILPVILYGLTPFVFLKGLAGESLTILNLVWDLTSDLIVTLIGLFVFREYVSPVKMLGVALSFVSLFLMTYEDEGWNTWLMNNYSKAKHVLGGG
jgi:multidrug transporter EmrE-like cation transporter